MLAPTGKQGISLGKAWSFKTLEQRKEKVRKSVFILSSTLKKNILKCLPTCYVFFCNVSNSKFHLLLITGVVTTKPFAKGEIVCDYHGIITTHAEGRRMMSENPGQDMCGLFFFKAGKTELCMDGHSPCECHVGAHILGRRIKHSSKRMNLQPLHCLFNAGGEKHAILFRAIQDIPTKTELSFDHGNKRKSFRGHGLDLTWLDF